MEENRSQEIRIPEGKLVFLVENNERFAIKCRGRILFFLEQWLKGSQQENEGGASGQALPAFLFVSTKEKFDAYMNLLSAAEREGDLIYALIDLGLPLDHTNTAEQEAAGREIYEVLRGKGIPTQILSGKNKEDVLRLLRQTEANYVSKRRFEERRETQREVANQIWGALKRISPKENGEKTLVTVSSPEAERGKRRTLPLAFESPSMLKLRRILESQVRRDAAAVLLVGPEGVEFEQLTWFFYELLRKRGELEYCCVSLGTGEDLGRLAADLRKSEDGRARFYSIVDVERLSEANLRYLAELLRSGRNLGPGGGRAMLVFGEDIEGVDRRKRDVLLDLFCLAGQEDFTLLEVPPLARRRVEDIELYIEYFRQQREEEVGAPVVDFDQQAFNLVKHLEYRRHFKDLAIFLDRLFRTAPGDMITVRSVMSIWPNLTRAQEWEVLDHILSTDPNEAGDQESLHDLCEELLVDRPDGLEELRGKGEFPGEESEFFEDLERIVKALETTERLETEKTGVLAEDDTVVEELLEQGATFWPWERYPICPRLLKELRNQGGVTVGLIRVVQVREEGKDGK